MALPLYLALTAAEFQNCSSLPEKMAWMACHYSPYGLGISNTPSSLPEGSMLILNDRTPPCGHESKLIAQQLVELVEKFQCSRVLLDFQRPDLEENAAVAVAAVAALPCPVGVSDLYAKALDCPVFLSPVPIIVPAQEHLTPWQDREIWLDAAITGETITVTETGNIRTPLNCPESQEGNLRDPRLHCHYRIQTYEDHINFTLWRTKEDLDHLLWEAEMHITAAVGLFQEFLRSSES